MSNDNFVQSDYQERQEARRERLEERAAKKAAASDAAFERSHSLVDGIPFGQPILVGHHSERGHRARVDKSWDLMGKSVGFSKEAEKLEQRASAVGTGGISTVDPEALAKLKAKLKNIEDSRETMKAVNKIVRKKISTEEKKRLIVEAELLSEKMADEILTPNCFGGIGFESFSLSNAGAEARRLKKRIAEIEKLQNSKPLEFKNDNFEVSINNGQIVIDFCHGKPNEEARKIVKRSAFKWSRYQGAWVRKVTANALASADMVIKSLSGLEEIY